MEILIYILIGFLSFGISFVITGLVDKYTKEDEIIENYLKDIDSNSEFLKSEEFKKEYKEVKKKAKVPFELRFSPVIAIITVASIVVLYIFKQDIVSFLVCSYLTVLLIISAFADIKACIIPDEVNIAGLIVGIIYVVYNYIIDIKLGNELLFGGIVGFAIFFIIGLFAILIYRREGMGGGDIKLMGVIGLFMGLKSIVQIFVLSFFIAAIISIFLLVTKIKKRDDYIPFGPFIVLATYFTMFVSGAYTYNQIYRYFMYR